MTGETDAGGGPDFFQSIVGEAQDGVVVLGADRIFHYANPAAEFLLGCRREDLVGEMFGLPLFPTDAATRVNVLSADGRMRVVELAVEALGSPPGSLLLRLKDVTLYHEDAALAREQVRRRDEFLAMLSHELRNPLAAIQGAALLLAREGVETAARQEAADAFDRQFRHLGRILDDLLDITRVSHGTLEMKKERTGLNELALDAAAATAGLVARKRHDLRVELPAEEVWVWGDPTRLEQAVANLLHNAAKYTQPGGRLLASVSRRGDEAIVRVRDDGPGIAADLLPRIFEPFVQGRQTLGRNEGGLGIGLALARTIVELHGGRIDAVPNSDGPGMTFVLRLPLAQAQAAPAPAPAPAPVPPLRILLVEDGDDARRMLAKLLALDGHEVREAADGESGLSACLEWRPDVALIDIGLPGMDGHELARRVRGDERGRSVRLVAITGYGMPKDIRDTLEDGFDHHLVKPLRYPELCGILLQCRVGVRECPTGP